MLWRNASTTQSVRSPNADALQTLALEALDFIADGLVVLDCHWHITYANATACSLLRWSLTEIAEREFWDLLPHEVSDQHQSATDQELQAKKAHVFVVHSKFEDIWVEYGFRSFSDGYVVNLKDVTENHRLEKLFEGSEGYTKLVFDANPNVMWLFDAQTLRILNANQAAVAFYGVPLQQFLKLSMGALFPDGEGAVLINAITQSQTHRNPSLNIKLCKQQKMDGTLMLVELACGFIKWQGHNAVLVSIADVAERHLADRELRRENDVLAQKLADANSELISTHRDMQAFTHALSNDLQSPLHVTNGYAAILAEKFGAVLGEAGLHYVSRIQASTKQLAKLVDDLRTLVQLPQTTRNAALVDLVPLCRLILDGLQKLEPRRQISLEMDASLILFCDKSLMTIALSCLLGNAWKFTSRKPETWIKVELQAGRDADELVLRVSDNGVGFDADYGQKLFTAFQRLHSAADFPGHGLGLAIVKRIATCHGGKAWAEMAPGKTEQGASFCMAFPQKIVDLTDIA